jgi:hypothetical protein
VTQTRLGRYDFLSDWTPTFEQERDPDRRMRMLDKMEALSRSDPVAHERLIQLARKTNTVWAAERIADPKDDIIPTISYYLRPYELLSTYVNRTVGEVFVAHTESPPTPFWIDGQPQIRSVMRPIRDYMRYGGAQYEPFLIQNIYDSMHDDDTFVQEARSELKHVLHDIPLRPPFPMTAFEMTDRSPGEPDLTMTCFVHESPDERPNISAPRNFVSFLVMYQMNISKADRGASIVGFLSFTCDDRWIPYRDLEAPGGEGEVVSIIPAEEGELMDELFNKVYFLSLVPTIKVLHLLNCKNTYIEKERPAYRNRQERRHAERSGHPQPETYRVVIKLPKKEKVILTGHEATKQQQDRIRHVVRGHFRTYHAHAPLMGKHVGTFWFPPHTRGSKHPEIEREAYEATLS